MKPPLTIKPQGQTFQVLEDDIEIGHIYQTQIKKGDSIQYWLNLCNAYDSHLRANQIEVTQEEKERVYKYFLNKVRGIE